MTNVLQVNRALAAEKNVFTLNSLFNPDGQPTVNRQSAVALQSGTRSEKAPLSPSCLRYLSRIALILCMLVMNIGQMWGASVTFNAFTSTSFNSDTIKLNNFAYLSKRTGHTSYIVYTNKFDISSTDNYLCANVVSGYQIDSVIYTCYSGSSQVSTGKKCHYSASNSYLASSSKATAFAYSGGITFPNSSSVSSGGRLLGNVKVIPSKGDVSVALGKKIGSTSTDNTNFCIGAVTIYYSSTAPSDSYDIHIGKNNDNYTDESLTNTSGSTWSKNITLDAGSYYEFKVKKTSGSTATWYGNNRRIFGTVAAWDFSTSDSNCKLYTSVAGSYTFSWDASNNKLSVTYPTGSHPTKRIYMACGTGTWCGDTPKFFVHSWLDSNTADTELTVDVCDGDVYTAEIPWFHDYVIITRQAPSSTGIAWDGDKFWNRSNGDFYLNNYNKLTFTDWTDGKGNFSGGTYSPTTYTITYAANGGGGSMTATSGICPDADQAITSNAFTAPTGCASFAHWTANVAVKVGGSTIAAGNPIANGATIQNINSNITLTAVWKLATPTITDNGDNTFSISGSMAGSSYYYTTNGSTPTTSSSLYSSAVDFSAGEANITAKAIAHKDGYVDSEVASQACTYHAAVTCTGDPTALVSGTLYQVSDMASACLGEITSTGQYFYGLSSNGKFYINGATNSNNASTGTVEIKTASNTIDKINFTGIAWFKGAGTTTCRSIKFVVPSAGTLTIYGKTSSGNGNVVIKTESSGNTTVIANSVNAYASGSTTVSAGTYYVLSDGGSAAIVGLKFVESACTTPAEPTAFTAGSITSTGATFSITDAGDAASYDIFYSTSSTAPTESTAATTTSDSKTKAVTGLTAETDYYAWVRSVCDADHKSAWVALSGSSFTTEEAVISTGVCWDPATTPADKLANNTTTLTTLTSRFAAIDGVTSVTVDNPGTGNGQCAGSDDDSGYLKVKNATTTKIITIVTTAPTNITIGGKKYGDNSGSFYLVKSTDTEIKLAECNTNAEDEATNLPAGTYYIYAKANTKSINFSKLCIELYECSTPAAPTAFTAGSITSDGATFSITDAANATSYDIFYSTSNTAPTASTVATTTSDSKTKSITGLTASTTYYAWVRSVCDASHKSAWVALTGSSFTTSCTDPAATLQVDSKTSSSATLSWDPLGAAANGYSIKLTGSGAGTFDWTNCATNSFEATGLDASTTYTFHVKAKGAGDCLSSEVTVNFTTTAPVRDCEDLVVVTATSKTAVAATVGTVVSAGLSEGNQFDAIDGYTYAVKPGSSGKLTLSPKAGSSFAAGDSLIFIVHNGNSGSKTEGFKIGSSTHTHSVAGNSLYYIRIELTASDIVDGKVEITRNSSDDRWVAVIIKTCDVLPPCTTPVLPSLSDQEVCAGNNGTAWNATITNEGSLATGETVSYEWKKKGSDAVLATTASYTPTDVAAADAGIYVVTATVSKTGNSDASASREVTLTVKFTATPMVTMTPSSVAPGETATLTATSSEGATFAWYSCDNAAGENPVNVASTATYTTPALAAGSHYYKVVATGDGTHTCGTAELIYQVEVAIPEQCQTYYWFPYATDAGTNEVTNNEDSFFSGTKTGSSNGGTYNFSVDGESLTATKNTGGSSMTITFTIPSGKTGTLGINCKGSSSNPIYLTHSSGTPQTLISDNSSYGAFEITDIAAGTYTVAAGASGGQSWTLCGMAVKVCAACDATTMDVSDAAPTYDMSVGGDFTEPTFTVKHNGSALSPQPVLSYTSSNSAIATVNETTGALTFHGITGEVTITATFAGDGTYCASTGSYTLTINCGSEVAPKIVLDGGTNLAGCNTTITLHAKKQDGTDFVGGTYQWYRDGEAIDGATAASYVVARAGTYTVTRTGACVQQSTNPIVITNTETEPTVERLVPFQYYHEDKEYSDQMKNRHLFAVHSQGTHEGKVYSMTATRVSDDANVLSMVADALWVQSGGLSGVDTVMINLNLLVDKGLAAGDEVRFVCSAIACGGISPVNEDIILKVIDQTPTLAFICSGADGDGTRNKKNFKYNGDFLTGYNKADLCLQTGGTSFDKDQELPLYTALKEHYLISPVNGYAPFNLLNYEPFDLLLLTDYPKASVNDLTKNKLDSMYVLVDYRPMLSFKTHMVAKTPSSWAVKGFTTSPTVPKTSQTHMNIVCYAHPMFNALSHLATDEVSPDHDEEGQMVYKMLSGGGYDDSKGVQGFELSDAGNFVTIAFTRYNATASAPGADGTVTWTPKDGDRKLISACERQTNIEARMILLSINADALCKLTEAGIAMVDSTLQYLLETDPLKVADCSLTFDDKTGDGKWSTPGNWAPRYNQIPNADVGAKIIKPCTIDIDHAIALSIKIEDNGKITIPATSALTVESSIRHMEGGILSAPSVSEISIAANAAGSGTLILNNITEDTRASVQMYSKASTDQSANTANWRWQYIGTPFNDVTDAMTNYYGSWLYLWNNGWTVVPKGGPLQPFAGYCITHPDGARTYNMTGTLATTADQTITVPAGQYMVIANSWTAPIQIDNFTDDDMKNLEARTIYFFNTGSDPNQSGTVQPEGVNDDRRWAAGTYVPVPIHSAPYTGDATIPAMQGFYVVGGASEGTLHLDYDRLVRPQKVGQNIISGQMHAPRRVKMANEEPNVMKLFVGGNRYDDRLVLLEREDFTDGFDDGWDGDKWTGNSVAPSVWALRDDNTHEAVSAIPELEGTIIGFQAGEDSEYTFRFDYSGEADAIYLLDTETKVYTRVLTGNTYTFTTADNAEHQRFVLTRSDAPQIATGVGQVPSDQVPSTKARKLLIEDKLYILLNGMLYDATGKLVR